MAIPAGFPLTGKRHLMIDPARRDELGVQLRMTTDAVVHDDLGAAVKRLDDLRLPAHRKYSSMTQAVHAFE